MLKKCRKEVVLDVVKQKEVENMIRNRITKQKNILVYLKLILYFTQILFQIIPRLTNKNHSNQKIE